MTNTHPLEAALAPTSRFTVKPEPGDSAWHSELIFDGAPTGQRVPGIRVEAQFSFGDRWLLLLDEDCPCEGYLFVLLLGAALDLIDQRELGMPYAAGFATRLEIAASNALELGFFDEHDRWRLTILPSPCYVWANWDRRETRQWSKLFSRRWMTLDEVTTAQAPTAG
jgi:hypothetical protein